MFHYITTTDSPVAQRPRRLNPENSRWPTQDLKLWRLKECFAPRTTKGLVRSTSPPSNFKNSIQAKYNDTWLRAATTIPEMSVPDRNRGRTFSINCGVLKSLQRYFHPVLSYYCQISVAPEDVTKRGFITPFWAIWLSGNDISPKNVAQTWKKYINTALSISITS